MEDMDQVCSPMRFLIRYLEINGIPQTGTDKAGKPQASQWREAFPIKASRCRKPMRAHALCRQTISGCENGGSRVLTAQPNKLLLQRSVWRERNYEYHRSGCPSTQELSTRKYPSNATLKRGCSEYA